MTIDEIMNLDADTINQLSDQELRKYTRQLVDAANKRMRRIEQRKQTFSPAYQGTRSSGGSFKTQRSTDRQMLLNEFKRARNFLQSKTSTAKGSKEWMVNVEQATGLTFGENDKFDILTKAGNLLSELIKQRPAFASYDSTILRDAIRKIIEESPKDTKGDPDTTEIYNRFNEIQDKIEKGDISSDDINKRIATKKEDWVTLFKNDDYTLLTR